jgi:hypothetical protein
MMMSIKITVFWNVMSCFSFVCMFGLLYEVLPKSSVNLHIKKMLIITPIARTVLEDICDKPIQIQSYCAVARLHGV